MVDRAMDTTGSAQSPPWRIIGLAMAAALVLAVSGVLFYRHEKLRIQEAKYEAMKAIASLKVAQIVSWRDERLNDVQRNALGPFMRASVRGLLLNEADAGLRARLQGLLQVIGKYEEYQDVILITADGRLLLSASAEKITDSDRGLRELAEKALAAGQPVFGDFSRCQTCKYIHLDVAVPVLDEAEQPLAVLVQRSDPQAYLYPLLQFWPTPSPSAETLLVRRDGDVVLFLSPQRHNVDMALSQRIPLTKTQVPAVQAALGTTGLFEGLDYRGLPVVADLKAVPGTPWAMVTKVDTSEILTEAREHGWFIVGLVVLGILMTGSMAAFFFNFSQRKLYRSLLLAEQEQRRADVTLQKTAARLEKLNRIYVVLNAVNRVIVREREPLVLFAEACRIAVQEGAFRMAWVGLLDESTMAIRPVAQAGATGDYLAQLGIVLDDSPRGQGPTATAFRSGQPVVVNDIEGDPCMILWREEAQRHGYRASATFPLTVQGRVVANLNLYSAEPGFFDEEELQLLDEMARSLAFSLDFIEQEKKRQTAEDEVRQAARQWQSSFAAISDAVCILDKDFAIVNANQAMAQLCQRSVEEMLGRRCWEVVCDSTQPITECPVSMRMQTGQRALTELAVNGKTFEVIVDPIMAHDGSISGAVHIMRDITQQKILEDQLAQSQKMETVGRLAGGVAHDFNNMLGVILGCAELALDQAEAGDPIRHDLEEIRKAAQRSASLTRQLLAFARKQVASPQVLILNETIEGMIKMLKRLLGENITLEWRPGTNLWPVKIDPSQVDQILANLTVNARDAIDRDGTMTIETANVVLDETYCKVNLESRPGNYVVLVVSDTGLGMDQATLAHIFEPFFTTKAMGKGTGLGLATTTYGVVKQNGGFINVYSEAGLGTTFRIYLPRINDEVASQEAMSAGQVSGHGSETVLLVEDEGAILQLGERILSRGGYSVLAANHPSQALELAACHPGPIHLLLTDIVMPGMNGKELMEKVKVLRPGIKTLFMSGYTADIIDHQGVLKNDDRFIEKPFSLKDMTAKVRAVLDS